MPSGVQPHGGWVKNETHPAEFNSDADTSQTNRGRVAAESAGAKNGASSEMSDLTAGQSVTLSATGKSKSGSAKRRRRKAASRLVQLAESGATESAGVDIPKLAATPAAGVPSLASPEHHHAPSSACTPLSSTVVACYDMTSEVVTQATTAGSLSCRRQLSPGVSSTEEVLRSIHSLQIVLGELRGGLMAEPQPSTTGVPSAIKKMVTAEPEPRSVAAKSEPRPTNREPESRQVATGPEPKFHPAAQAAQTKTKEEIKAERKAKAEAAKLAKAARMSHKKQQVTVSAAAAGDNCVREPSDDHLKRQQKHPPQSAGSAPSSGPPPQSAGSAPSSGPPPQSAGSAPSSGPPPQSAGSAPSSGLPPQSAGSAPSSGPPPQSAGSAPSSGLPSQSAGSTPSSGRSRTSTAVPPEKSKADLKAERRAKQDTQRAAKATAALDAASARMAGQQKTAKSDVNNRPSPLLEQNAYKSDSKFRKSALPIAPKKGVQMFSHLPPFDSNAADALMAKPSVHPAMLRFGLRLSHGRITGSNAGAVALLTALAELVQDYSTPPQRELRRDLPDLVRRALGHVRECRPLSVAMENVAAKMDCVIRSEVPENASDSEAKRILLQWIESFIQDNICKAMTAITQYAKAKIEENDVILTYGRATAVLGVLCSARRAGLKFRVLVVDSRPGLEGCQMLRQLLDADIPCTYGLIGAISHLMQEATKVLLGAHALLTNGMVLSRAGSALISLAGRAANRPVLVCCETYKFSERVQTDSQVYNQLGDPDELAPSRDSPLNGWRKSDSLSLLNLTYDVTPPELVDVVITELGAIPCTSVPAVLRLQQHAVY